MISNPLFVRGIFQSVRRGWRTQRGLRDEFAKRVPRWKARYGGRSRKSNLQPVDWDRCVPDLTESLLCFTHASPISAAWCGCREISFPLSQKTKAGVIMRNAGIQNPKLAEDHVISAAHRNRQIQDENAYEARGRLHPVFSKQRDDPTSKADILALFKPP